jgi:hypothetical protein
MFVSLSSAINPDRPNQDIELIRPYGVEVKSFLEASQTCRAFIEKNGLGAGNWAGGNIYDENGQKIAKVSYIGRVWDKKDREILI